MNDRFDASHGFPAVRSLGNVVMFAGAREEFVWLYAAQTTVSAVDVWLNGVWQSALLTPTGAFTSGSASLLIAGSAATDNPDDTVVLAAGTHDTLVRLTDDVTMELIVRPGGRITVI